MFTHNAEAETGDAVKVVLDRSRCSARQIADYLFNSGIQSVLIEGGAKCSIILFQQGFGMRQGFFTGRQHFKNGTLAPVIKGKIFSQTKFTFSSLEVILNDGS